MKKIFTILIILFSLFGFSQVDTLKIIEIKPKDTICFGYVLDTNSNNYVGVFCFYNDLQPELNNFIDLAKSDYVANDDTLTRLLYQNKSASFENKQRFFIQTAKGNDVTVYMQDLSLQLQQSIYLFGRKYMNVYYQGKFYK